MSERFLLFSAIFQLLAFLVSICFPFPANKIRSNKIRCPYWLIASVLLFFTSVTAQAACSNNTPGANASVVCTGTDTIGISATGNNVSVSVQAGASVVTPTLHTILLQGSSNITNSGDITNSSPLATHAITLNGTNTTITNTASGTITTTGGGSGISIFSNAGGAVVNNSGTFTGGSYGISSNSFIPVSTGNLTIINNATGIISGVGFGIGIGVGSATGVAEVDNYGLIQGPATAAVDLLGSPTGVVLMGPGALFTGLVISAPGGNNTLILAGTGTGTFNLSNLGPAQQFRNFSQIVKDTSSIWTVTGSNTLPWTVKNGTVNVASAASIGGTVALNQGSINLTAGSSLIGGPLTIGSTGVLTGIGIVTGNVSNGGTISPGTQLTNPTAAAVGQLTIQGNYSQTGSQINIRTQLNGDSSPTDQLVINGTVSGVTPVYVTPLPGSNGALTVNGIPIILTQYGGASGAFVLGQPVQAGAYQYLLQQSSNNWNLFSHLTDSMGTKIPLYRFLAAAYALGHVDNLEYNFASVGSLQERVGDLAGPHATTGRIGAGTWGRLRGQSLQLEGSSFSAQHNDFYFLQVGQDLPLRQPMFKQGQTHTGIMMTLGNIQGDFYDPTRSLVGLDTHTSSLNTRAAALGLYSTHYWDRQSYLDLVLQGSYQENHYATVCPANCYDTSKQLGFAQLLSVEGGYPLPLGTHHLHPYLHGWVIEPEAQLIYQHLGLKAFNDSVSPISAVRDHALRGRLGLRLFQGTHHHSLPLSQVITPFLVTNLYQDFIAPSSPSLLGTTLNNTLRKTWLDLGAGLSSPLMQNNLYSFLDVRYQTAFARRHGFQAIVGLRVNV